MYRGFNLELKKGDLPFKSSSQSVTNKKYLADNSAVVPSFRSMAKMILSNHQKNEPTKVIKKVNKALADQIRNGIKKGSVKELIHKGLDEFLQSANILDGTQIQDNWFPKVNANVFISHSHQDESVALELADWLGTDFGIKSFIDSFVWGYSDDLLKQIHAYDNSINSNGSFDHQKQNIYSSHVHMMLATALTMMIDKTECIIFLNTPNSVSLSYNKTQTHSPWLYHELMMSQLIRETERDREFTKLGEAKMKKSLQESALSFSYNLDLKHLTTLNLNTLKNWSGQEYSSPEEALDRLYKIAPHNSNPQKGII